LRNCDGKKVRGKDVETLARWDAKKPANEEIPFVVARIVLQDFTGVPLVVDLAAMRSAVKRLGGDAKIIEPLVPVDLVVDHSVQVDFFGSAQALRLNLEMEFKRNRERYQFLKWGQQAFKTFQLIPPGIGIVHQVNLEYLAKGVLSQRSEVGGQKSEIFYPDTLVGTDSHTTMINGLGVVGWGVGGIEAEAGMLGQPVYFLTPEVVGVHLSGRLKAGVTATDLVLHITQMLRAQKVVGKFVEFYGEGAASLPVPGSRLPLATCRRSTAQPSVISRSTRIGELFARHWSKRRAMRRVSKIIFAPKKCSACRARAKSITASIWNLDLGQVQPGVAGPKRPQDRINLPELGQTFRSLLQKTGERTAATGLKMSISARNIRCN
jgi:aconitate hydratase